MRFSNLTRSYRRAAILPAVLALNFLVDGADTEGAEGAAAKYCTDNGSTMLLVQPRANDGLEFGISSWNARGNYSRFTAWLNRTLGDGDSEKI